MADKNVSNIVNELSGQSKYYESPDRIDYLDSQREYTPEELFDAIHNGMDSDWDLFAYDGDTVHMNHKNTNNGYVYDRASKKISPKSYDDYLKESKQRRAMSYLNDYYDNKFDLETLHTNLWTTFGDLKTAYEGLADNDPNWK